jgi:hypothetical protein
LSQFLQRSALVTHNLTATNRILIPNQIDITIRKEFVMTPPPALLSGTMQGAAVSSALGGGQAVIPAQILVVDEPGQPGRARSRLPDRMTKPFAGIGLQRRL